MTLSKEIIEILEYIGDKFGIAIDWSSENVIPNLQMLGEKYIKYEVATSVAWLVFALIVISGLIIATIKCRKLGDGEIGFFLFLCLVFSSIIFIPIIIIQVEDIITSLTFPELQILQYLKDLTANA